MSSVEDAIVSGPSDVTNPSRFTWEEVGGEKNGQPNLSGRPPGTGLATRRSGVVASQRSVVSNRMLMVEATGRIKSNSLPSNVGAG